MELNFNDVSQSIFDDITGTQEETRSVSQETAKTVFEDKAQELMDKRKTELSRVIENGSERFSGIGGGFKKVETYDSVAKEVIKEEAKDKEEERKSYYGQTPSSRFVSSSSSTQTESEKKQKEEETYVLNLKDELNNFSKNIKNRISAEAALSELQRKRVNDKPWTIKEIQASHEMFKHTGGARYITKETERVMKKSEAMDRQKLRKEFNREKDIVGFLIGGLNLWKD